MSKINKCILIFPPVWLPDVPFLSTPALTAFLKQNDINVEQIDLNIKFWKYLYSPNFLTALYKTLIKKYKVLITKAELSIDEIELIKKLSIINEITENQFIDEVSKQIISRDIFLEFIGLSSDFISYTKKIPNYENTDSYSKQDYHDLLYNNISLSQYSYSIENLLKISSDKFNPYNQFYSNIFYKESEFCQSCLFGISIAANNQVVPAFTLAYFIKKNFKNSQIVIGGSWCTLVEKDLFKHFGEFDFIDYIVIREGEVPLLKLVQSLSNNSEINHIEGLCYKKEGNVFFNSTQENLRQNQLPTPDFTGLPLNQYFEKNTLPIQASRGCYWGKCIFCSYPFIEQKFKQRSVDKVIEDIKLLQNLYNIKVFSFVDSLISPAFANKLSDKLIAENIRIEWVILARLEKQFTPQLLYKMSKSGCTTICWGLESGNKRVLDVIRKNINLGTAEFILQNSSSVNIHNRVLVMFGLPSETISEAFDTIDFLKRNLNNIHSISYNYYHPEKNTPIEKYAAQNKIELKKHINKELDYGYIWNSLMTPFELNLVYKEYNKLEKLIHQNENIPSLKNEIKNFINKNVLNTSFNLGKENHSIISFVNNNEKAERCFFEIKEF